MSSQAHLSPLVQRIVLHAILRLKEKQQEKVIS